MTGGGSDWQPPADWRAPEGASLDVWRVPLAVTAADWGLLAEDERARADRLVVPFKRDQLVAARAALRRILGRTLERDPASLRFAYGRNGKPSLADFPQLRFNLSHSGALALVVVGREVRLGIDIELCDRERPLDRMARRFFSEDERAVYEALAARERPTAFYRAWTRKEAYVKAWGTGLTFSSRRFTVTLDAAAPARLLSTEMPDDDDPAAWHWRDLEPGPGYAAAVCWLGGERRVRLWG